MTKHKELRIGTALVGAMPILIISISALTGGMESSEPPPALFAAMGFALFAAVMAGVTAAKMDRRWWPWSVGAMFIYGLPAVLLACLKPGNHVTDDPNEVARRMVPEPAPWFIAAGVFFGLMVVVLLLIDLSSSDPVAKETVSSMFSMVLGIPMLVLLLVGASKRGGKKKILAARELLAGG